MNIIIPISSAISNFSDINSTQIYNGTYYSNFTHNQVISIVVGTSGIFLALTFLMVLIIYQKYNRKVKRSHAHSLTSNNPCYANGSLNDFGTNGNHAHCNMSVLTDFYDIDDLNSLDNDSFLNSLENAIFVGYLNHNRPTYSVDHSINRLNNTAITSNNQPVHEKRESRARPMSDKRPNRDSSRHTSLRSGHNHQHVRVKKSKRNTNAGDLNLSHDRSRNKSESGCDITRSTSNLISTSNRCLTASIDSICDSSHDSRQIVEITDHFELDMETSRDPKIDNKMMESSAESRTSVNSSSAMMSSYFVENNTSAQVLPDLVNSSLPKSAKRHKRVASNYSNQASSRDDYSLFTNPKSGQILDPLRAGQTFHFPNDDSELPIQPRHEHQLSPSFGISNIGIFDYNVSS